MNTPSLTQKQEALIAAFLRENGLKRGALYHELQDHLCCLTEEAMAEGWTFQRAFELAQQRLCPEGPLEIQKSIFLETLTSYLKMRKFQFLLGYLGSLLIFVGYTFKVMHWPSANIQLMLGYLLFCWGFVPLYWANRYRLDVLHQRAKSVAYYVLNGGLLSLCGTFAAINIMKWAPLPVRIFMFVSALLIVAFYFLPRLFRQMYRENVREATS